MDSPAGFGQTSDTAKTESDSMAKEKTRRALEEFLRPEFINRVDEIITFRSLDREDFKKIASLMLGDLKKALNEKGISAVFTEKCIAYVADKSYSVKYGARNMRRFIQTNIEDLIAEEIITRKGDINAISVDCPDGEKPTIVSI